MKGHICKIVKILSQGELYDKVREIQHQGYSPPVFARIDNVPYYGLTKEQSCPTNCRNLHHEILCNSEEVIEQFFKEKYVK